MITGIGTDLIEIQRIEKTLNRFTHRFRRRFFTNEEQESCDLQFHPAQHYAVRFAAKEAVAKSLGMGLRGKWKDIRIGAEKSGKPLVFLAGKFALEAEKQGVQKVEISMTHSHQYAMAFAIAIRG